MNLQNESYVIRQKILKILGAELHVFDPNENVVLFTKLKAFKLKEDIRIYTNEDMTEEVMSIQARSIIDFSATYDIYDSKSQQKIGALGRKGLKSILKDEWVVLDKEDNQIGVIKEDSTIVALIRRFVISLIPQKYHCYIDGKEVITYQQNFNPFVRKIKVDFSLDNQNLLDKRVGIAAGILLCVIEGKQG
jgi:hypothetical protein